MGEHVVEMDEIKKIAVLGSGSMGIDLGILFALHGVDVVLWHRKDRQVAHARLIVRLDKYVGKEILSAGQRQQVLERVETTHELRTVSQVDLVLETIVEDLDAKTALLKQVEEIVSEKCILVSNTSSLSIDELGTSIMRPDRLAGLHFFNPALRMELVEVVKGIHTSDRVVEVLKQLCTILEKQAVVVKDSPGFIVNYLMAGQINQAIGMYEQGIASADDIDNAVKLGLHHPMGPLALADYIGLDILSEILDALHRQTSRSIFLSSRLLEEKIIAGELGRKSGRGFYAYDG